MSYVSFVLLNHIAFLISEGNGVGLLVPATQNGQSGIKTFLPHISLTNLLPIVPPLRNKKTIEGNR